MKVIPPKLAAVCLVMFVATIAGQAAEKYDDGMEIIHFFGNFRLRYNGIVTAVERPAQGDALVRILATKEYLWKKDQPGERKERKVSKECVLRWTRSDQPVPFATGMSLSFIAQADGDVTAAVASAPAPYYRKRPDGLIEVLLHIDGLWLRVLPDRLNLNPAVDIGWSRQYGLVLSMFEADVGAEEEEAMRSREKGLPMSNVPGERIQIGRDGWKKTDDLLHEKGKGPVPPKQYIGAAG